MRKVIIISVCLLGLLASSCMKMDYLDMESEVKGKIYPAKLTVNGIVKNQDTSEPVPGIRLQLSSYSSRDRKGQNPLGTEIVFSDGSGFFTIKGACDGETEYFLLTATDVDGAEGGGEYSESTIKIDWNGNVSTYNDVYVWLKKK